MRIKTSLSLLTAFALLQSACAGTNRHGSTRVQADSARLRADIEYLASDALEGRGTGAAGNDTVAAYVARRYRSLGLRAMSPGYLLPSMARSSMNCHGGANSQYRTQNVVAYLQGTDRALCGQVVVVGAHIDHLGRSGVSA